MAWCKLVKKDTREIMTTNPTHLGIRLSQDKWFAYNTLIPILRYLEIEDLPKIAQVCKLWYWIAYDENLWHSLTLATCEEHLALMVNRYGHKVKNIEIDGLARVTNRKVAKSLRKMSHLRKVTLADCRLLKINQLLDALDPNIVALQIEQTHREVLETYSLDFVKRFPNLTSFGIMTFCNVQPHTLEALRHLKKLTHLFLYDEYNNFPYEVFKELSTLKYLQLGGDTNDFFDHGPVFIYSLLKELTNLYKIKLEIYPICNYNFFQAINQLPHLTELELHGEIISRHDGPSFIQGLAQCTNIKVLILEMDPEFSAGRTIYDHAIRNSILQKAVLKLKKTLNYLHWLIPGYYIKRVKEVWGVDDSMIFQKSRCTPRTLRDISILSVEKFQKKLAKAMKNTQVFVLVQHYGFRYCPMCRANRKW